MNKANVWLNPFSQEIGTVWVTSSRFREQNAGFFVKIRENEAQLVNFIVLGANGD